MMRRKFAAMLLMVVCACLIASDLFAQRPGGRGQRPGGRGRSRSDTIKAGDKAPDFTLKSPDGKQTMRLSEYRGKRPVALVFGSYT